MFVIKQIHLLFSLDRALRYQNFRDKPNSQQVKVKSWEMIKLNRVNLIHSKQMLLMINQMRIKIPKESSNQVRLSPQVALEDLTKIQKISVALTSKKTKKKSYKGYLKAIRSFWRKRETILLSRGATLRPQITFLEILSRVSLTLNQSLLSSSKPMRTLKATKTLG